MTRLVVRAYWVAKAGNQEAEWEDGAVFDEASGRIALADGATSAFRSGTWANMLCDAFVTDPPATADDITGWVERQARAFEGMPPPKSDSWYSGPAAERGSLATFLGLDLRPIVNSDGATWRAFAVGDTCMFHVRDGRPLSAFPLGDASEFDTTPHLLSTRPVAGEFGAQHVMLASGECAPGDVVLLATDALAKLIYEYHDDRHLWRALLSMNRAAFVEFVAEMRALDVMVNDDVTLVRCRVKAG